MFETDEDKFFYLVGCALNGTATAQADIPRLTKQAYGIAEEMLSLINKLKMNSKESKPKDASEITAELPGKAPEPVKPLKTPTLPAFINKAVTLQSGASAAIDALGLKEPIKLDDLASHDKGWNYTPWGKS
jgi:hypothetical protein